MPQARTREQPCWGRSVPWQQDSCALCTLAGLLRGGCDPLFFELSAEAAHPATAATAGGVLTLWYHLVLVAMLSVPAGTLQAAVPVAMAGCMLVSSAMMVPVRIRYTRRE